MLGHRQGSFKPIIACYHAVSDSWPHFLAVPPDLFRRQLEVFLGRGFRPADLPDVLAFRNRRLLHVTFDDAFASVAQAVPVLERLGIPFTIFVCTDFADGGRPLVIPELETHARENPIELATMDWAQLARLPADRVEIGSHTMSHAHLTLLADDELKRELTESRRRIEDELGCPCRYLAYPFGEEDGRVRAAAREAGYLAAFALPGNPGRRDDYAIPRLGLYAHDTPARTAIKVSWPGRRVSLMRRRVRRKARP
jgi:peptidoglycan/xylan/chitin deacetylase (PgdA/CDA1 family)